ncbi:MAG: right-handed parallel beta-helix repeat-containing protein [Acidobacteriota bacterium]|nr:right-handed parallel beta-helix repeat-containing protein [Acidobacteriota bacterium]
MKVFVSLCFFALLTISTNSVSAATYYVATNGSNNNPGSAEQPWATLQYAVDAIASGDTIIVRAGTYAGCRIGKSGAANAPKILRAEAGAHVLLNTLSPSNKHQSIVEVELFDTTVSYWVIDGFEITGAPRHGVDIRYGSFITVQNCFTHHNGTLGRGDGVFLGFSDHPTIQFNETSYNTEHGIYHSNSADYPTIRGNRSHHNAAAGILINGDLSQGGDGMISFGLIEKNVIYENGASGGSGINCDGLFDSVIRNNLLYANHASGISLYAIDAAAGSSRNQVYHNTIVQAAGARYCINIPASDGAPNPTGNIVKNNILYNPDARGSVVIYSGAASGFQSDYNIVVNRFSANAGDTIITLQQWQALGYDTHSIIAAPAALFVDAASNNYRLKSGSPAINAGTIVAGATDDLDGLARPQGTAPDIGCYEAASGAATSVSAASYSGAAFAPEAITVAFGTGLATSTLVANTTPLPVTLAWTTVKVRDNAGIERAAPLFFVSPTQINYQIPPGTATGAASLTITNANGAAAQGSIQIAMVAPGLFTANASGQGVAAALALRVKADGTQAYEPVAQFDAARQQFVARPIDLGPDLGNATDQVFLILYGTGLRYRSALSAVGVKAGGIDAPVSFAGAIAGFAGLDQINARLPRSLVGRGEVDVMLTVDGQAANTVKISIK